MTLSKIKKMGTLNPNTADSLEIVARAKHVNPVIDVVNGLTDGTGTSNELTATIGTATITTANITTLNPTTINRASQVYTMGVGGARVGATAGWVVTGSTNIGQAALPASQTASTLVVPVTIPLKVGWIVTAFSIQGQAESAGGALTVDCDLRKLTVAAADLTDASIGAITQIAKTADYAINDSKTLAAAETIAVGENLYFLVTGTTAGSTDIAISGFTITVTEI